MPAVRSRAYAARAMDQCAPDRPRRSRNASPTSSAPGTIITCQSSLWRPSGAHRVENLDGGYQRGSRPASQRHVGSSAARGRARRADWTPRASHRGTSARSRRRVPGPPRAPPGRPPPPASPARRAHGRAGRPPARPPRRRRPPRARPSGPRSRRVHQHLPHREADGARRDARRAAAPGAPMRRSSKVSCQASMRSPSPTTSTRTGPAVPELAGHDAAARPGSRPHAG